MDCTSEFLFRAASDGKRKGFVTVQNPKASLEPSKLMRNSLSLFPVSLYFMALSFIPLTFLSNLLEPRRLLRHLFAGILVSGDPPSMDSPSGLLIRALSLIPISYFYLAFALTALTWFYNFIEIHLLRDLLNGFRGGSVSLTFNPDSNIYQSLISKCRILHGRYLATPWLSSPHLQTAFVSFLGNPPEISYRRELLYTVDGGTIALDWLRHYDVMENVTQVNGTVDKDDKLPILVVLPGVSSDSASPYIKHIAHKFAEGGWDVCVSNHRGLGGVSITSDCFPDGGWTEDLRLVVTHLHDLHPGTPLCAVGTSIGANILVKYLGEEGVNAPLLGAAAVSCPWDLLICDRYLKRGFLQKLYDNAIAVGLKTFAQMHKPIMAPLVDWEGIQKSRRLRDYDGSATCYLGKHKTVDTYYRNSSCVHYVGNVAVPMLGINAMDDPICPPEAIAWDECRANKNIVLAVTEHGGHVGYYEGPTASSIWYIRAVEEFFAVLQSNRSNLRKKEIRNFPIPGSLEPSSDHTLHSNAGEDDKRGNEKKEK